MKRGGERGGSRHHHRDGVSVDVDAHTRQSDDNLLNTNTTTTSTTPSSSFDVSPLPTTPPLTFSSDNSTLTSPSVDVACNVIDVERAGSIFQEIEAMLKSEVNTLKEEVGEWEKKVCDDL